MEYLLLVIVCFSTAIQNILTKQYSTKSHGGTFTFGAMSTLVALLFFVAVNRDWSFNDGQIFYSLGFGASYCTAVFFSVLAIKNGPLALTNLIISASLLIPTFYGIVFLNEPVTTLLVIGLVLLVSALVMTNYQKDQDSRPTLKWVIYSILASVGNGMCSAVQKAETMVYGESGKNVFMIIALSIVTIVLLSMSFAVKSEREELKHNFSVGWLLALGRGFSNGLTNFLVMLLNALIPASVLFPVISAAVMIIVFLYSTTVVKEKYSTVQKLGFAVGLLSIILLNL
ncbi:MAG: EamA family transporter [Clostridia bacterium]|nr:EamA family transporter [Clostridia bacterium]